MKKSKSLKAKIFFNAFFILVCICVLVPFVMLISISISNEKDIANYGYRLIPMNVDFSAYKYVFKNPASILNAYKVTALFSFGTMALGMISTAMVAYPLTKPWLKGRQAISFYLYFTMLFSGGMIPTYILMTQYLHLDDTIWAYILPALVNPWYVFMMRTFFAGIPEEISESAIIDGASEFRIFVQMILPLSKPVLATVALFLFLDKWNDWYTSMMYVNDEKLISLQYMLQRILDNIKLMQDSAMSGGGTMGVSVKDIPTETVRMAIAIVVAGPALIVFPFFQKYFVKGLTVGSVKG